MWFPGHETVSIGNRIRVNEAFVIHCVILQTPYRKFSIQLVNFCFRVSDHWSRVRKHGRGGEGDGHLPGLLSLQCRLCENMAAEFTCVVLPEALGRLDSCKDSDYSRILLQLEYLNCKGGKFQKKLWCCVGGRITG